MENSQLNQAQRPLPLPEKLVSSSEQKEQFKGKLKATPKKVSLILKIENDLKTKSKVLKGRPTEPLMTQDVAKTGALEYLPRGHEDSGDDVTSRSSVARPRAVELCVMSQSYTSLPLPETSLTLQHCHALSRDTLQFATLSRRKRRESVIRHSRSFSSFHPVPVPTVTISDHDVIPDDHSVLV